jgi:hypothetical protein
MSKTNTIKLASEIATEIVEHRIGSHLAWVISEDDSECFTDEAQDLFNEIYLIVINHLEANQ